MEDFVSFELAKKLKEIGFLVKCFAFYTTVGILHCVESEGAHETYLDLMETNNFGRGHCVDAPLICQVLKWLREEKKIHVAIGYSGETEWRYVIVFLGDKYFENPNIIHKHFNSYESAALAGIEYILDKLI